MADEKLEVEMIAQDTGILKLIEKQTKFLDKLEKKFETLGQTSEKSAKAAAGSFNAVEKELKEAEAQLKRLTMGTKDFDLQQSRVKKLRDELGRMKAELKGSAETSGRLSQIGDSAIAKVAAMAGGLLGMQKIVSTIVEELDRAKQLRIESAGTLQTFEQALADLGQNIGAGAIPQARQMISDQAPVLGTTQQGLANLIGVAISAGAKDLEEAMSLSTAALKLTVGDATKALALVGGTLDVASLGGSKNFEGALGQLLQVQSQVRSTNLSEFGANIGPGLAAATAQGQNMQGVTTERALEMSSVISQIIKDQTGSNTATTLRQFFTRLDAFTPEREKTLDDGGVAKVSKKDIEQFKAAATFEERLNLLRKNEAIKLQFLETQRESIGKTSVREILDQSPRAVQFEQKAVAAISGIDDAQKSFTDLVAAVGGETPALQAQRRMEAVIQRQQTSGVTGLEGQAELVLQTTFDKINQIGVDALKVRAAAGERAAVKSLTGRSTADVGIDQLKELLQPIKVMGMEFTAIQQVNQQDRKVIMEAIKELQGLKKAIEQVGSKPLQVVAPVGRPKNAPLPAATAP